MNISPQGHKYQNVSHFFQLGVKKRGFFRQTDACIRHSYDDVAVFAAVFTSRISVDLHVSRIIEFEEHFYVVVSENGRKKGAFDLLVNPYTGRVCADVGPNMIWNIKFGYAYRNHQTLEANTIDMEDAAKAGQNEIDQYIHNAKVIPDGMDFYGYYSFFYLESGSVAGLISVNGINGQVWLHNWFGSFIGEMQISH